MTSTLTQPTDLNNLSSSEIESILSELPVETKAKFNFSSTSVFVVVKNSVNSWQDEQSKNTANDLDAATKFFNLPVSIKSSAVFEKPKPFSIDSEQELFDFLHTKGKNSLGYMIGKSFDPKVSFSWSTQAYLFAGFNQEDVVKKAADPVHIKNINEAIALIDKAKSELTLSRSAKVQSTNMQKRLVDFRHQLELSKSINDGIPVTGIIYHTWGVSSSSPASVWPFDMVYLYKAMEKANDDLVFKQSMQDLGFDPFDGTTSQYTEYILKKEPDNSWATFLDLPSLKIYALHLMKAPGWSLDGHSIQEMKKIAGLKKKHLEFQSYDGPLPLVPRDAVNGAVFPSQPNFLTTMQWEVVKYAVSTACDPVIFESNLSNRIQDFEKKFMPDWLPSTILSVFSVKDFSSFYSSNYAMRTLTYLLRSGIWYSGLTYKSTHSHPVVFPLKPGMSVYRSNYDNDVYIFVPKFVTSGKVMGFDHSSYGSWNNYNFDESSFTLVHAASSKITYQDSQYFDKSFDKSSWDALATAEKKINVPTELTGVQAIHVKSVLRDFGDTRKVTQFPYKIQALLDSYPDFVEMILFKFDNGHYDPANEEEADWEEFVSEHPEFASLKDIDDEVQVNVFVKGASNIESTLMLSTLGAVNHYPDDDVLGAKFSLREALLAWKEVNKPQAANIVGMPATGVQGVLKAIPSLYMGGQQPKIYYADANGDVYMGKPNNADKFRPDAEQAASDTGRLFGFNVPSSDLRIIDGQYTHVQTILENVSSLVGVKPLSLDDQTLIVAMQSHVLDWTIANHDSSGINLALQGVTNSKLWKIDLGQAWKALGSDKLEAGWELPGNYGGVWYNDFYAAVKSKKIDQSRLDKITKSVLTKAKYVSTYHDDEYKQILSRAFKNRTYYPAGMDKDSFTALAFGRKASTFTDFFLFYQNLYTTSGYVFSFDVETFDSTRLEGTDAHLSVSEEFAQEVLKNKIFGKSLMVGDPQIEDSHVFFYTLKNKNSTILRGELKVRDAGDKAIESWIVNYLSFTPDTVTKKKSSQIVLPNTQEVMDVLVAFAKNTNFHYDDNAYNSKYMTLADSKIDWVNSIKANIDSISWPDEDIKAAWLSWSDQVLLNFETVKNSVKNHTKVPVMPSEVFYTPPKKASKPVEKPKVSSKNYVVEVGQFSTPKTTATSENGIATYQVEQNFGSMKAYHITSDSYPHITLQYAAHKFTAYGNESGNFSNRGRMQIIVSDWDGSPNVIEESFNFIRDMGLTLEEATEDSLEFFFWDHLANILADRKLKTEESKTLKAIQSNPRTLDNLKSAFAGLWSSDIVDNADWRPQFSDFRAHIIEDIDDSDNKPKSGRPHWIRPDFNIEDYAKSTGGVLPSRQDSSVGYLINGGYTANEEKIRFTGTWGVKANSPDADRRRGSGQFAFMRQGQFISSNGFYIEPYVMARTTNYSYKSDTYGDALERKSGSPFNIADAAKHGYGNSLPGFSKPSTLGSTGSNEVMIKYGWSTWDDIAIIMTEGPSERSKIIDFYKKKGITEIRGLSLEERVVCSQSDAKDTMAKIWKMYSQK